MSEHDDFQQEFLERQATALDQLPETYFDGAEHGQSPTYIAVECGDSREHTDLTHGATITSLDERAVKRGIGANIVSYTATGEDVVDGTVDYFLGQGTDKVVIADHYGCGAVKAAITAYLENGGEVIEATDGITAETRPIVQFIDGAVVTDQLNYEDLQHIDFGDAYDPVWADAVEQNVIGQTQYLQDRLPELKEKHDTIAEQHGQEPSMSAPEDITVYPAVNDFIGLRGRRGTTYFL